MDWLHDVILGLLAYAVVYGITSAVDRQIAKLD